MCQISINIFRAINTATFNFVSFFSGVLPQETSEGNSEPIFHVQLRIPSFQAVTAGMQEIFPCRSPVAGKRVPQRGRKKTDVKLSFYAERDVRCEFFEVKEAEIRAARTRCPTVCGRINPETPQPKTWRTGLTGNTPYGISRRPVMFSSYMSMLPYVGLNSR